MKSQITTVIPKPFAEDTLQWLQVGNDWNTVSGIYGRFSEVTAKFCLPQQKVGIWLAANLSYESEISLRITPMDEAALMTRHLYAHIWQRGNYGREYGENLRHRLLASVLLDEVFGINWDIPMEVTLQVENGEAVAIVNGLEVLRTPIFEPICDYGYFGCRSTMDSPIDVEWIRVTYTPMPAPEAAGRDIIPTTYCEDFTQKEAGPRGEYWLEPLHNDYWSIMSGSEGSALATKGADSFAPVYLHVFDRDTKLKVRFCPQGNSGGCGFLFRLGPDAMYLKLRADMHKKQWQLLEARIKGGDELLLATADMMEVGMQEMTISLQEHTLTLEQNGKTILHSEGKIRNMGFGRPGFFTDGAAMKIYELSYTFPAGGTPNPGIMEYSTPEPGCCSGSMEILPIGDGKAIGFSNSGNNFMFNDHGADCQLIENDPYKPLNPGGEYISITKLRSGKYLRVDIFTFMASQSEDLIHWEDLGYVIAPERQIDHMGRRVFLFHVNTIREIQLPTGQTRIFVPLLHRLYRSDGAKGSSGNYSMIFYSDDGGRNWQEAKNDTRDTALDTCPPHCMWGESKVILCADNSLRLYMTRGRVGCVQYLTSRDGGETWPEYGVIPHMQCALSSYCVEKDERTGMFYFVWVNNNAQIYGSIMWRTRVSLAQSRDGMNWEYLCDVDRFDERTARWDNSPTFQIVDPSITIDGDYLLISYGRGENETFASQHSFHRAQRARVVRVPIATLKPRPWDEVSVSNMKFPARLEITALPKRLQYFCGETVDLTGGTVRIVALDGRVTEKAMSKLFFRKEPVLDVPGKKTIIVYHPCGISCKFDIDVQ